jgi:hypothetical protein
MRRQSGFGDPRPFYPSVRLAPGPADATVDLQPECSCRPGATAGTAFALGGEYSRPVPGRAASGADKASDAPARRPDFEHKMLIFMYYWEKSLTR